MTVTTKATNTYQGTKHSHTCSCPQSNGPRRLQLSLPKTTPDNLEHPVRSSKQSKDAFEPSSQLKDQSHKNQTSQWPAVEDTTKPPTKPQSFRRTQTKHTIQHTQQDFQHGWTRGLQLNSPAGQPAQHLQHIVSFNNNTTTTTTSLNMMASPHHHAPPKTLRKRRTERWRAQHHSSKSSSISLAGFGHAHVH